MENPNKNAPVILNDSVIRVRQGAAGNRERLWFHGVRATVSITGNNIVPDQVPHKQVRIVGSTQSSGLLEKVDVECRVDLSSKSITAAGNFTGLQFSPKLLERLPIELSEALIILWS
ncbi:MAG: hypothetical protein U0930_10785 [Pirellulales bacterium]